MKAERRPAIYVVVNKSISGPPSIDIQVSLCVIIRQHTTFTFIHTLFDQFNY